MQELQEQRDELKESIEKKNQEIVIKRKEIKRIHVDMNEKISKMRREQMDVEDLVDELSSLDQKIKEDAAGAEAEK